jgi:hypothetical protein
VLAAEHLLGFAGFDFGAELVERPRQIVADRLSGLGPFDQHGQIVDAPLERVAETAVGLERLAALQDLLRRRLVFPEIRLGGFLFDLR